MDLLCFPEVGLYYLRVNPSSPGDLLHTRGPVKSECSVKHTTHHSLSWEKIVKLPNVHKYLLRYYKHNVHRYLYWGIIQYGFFILYHTVPAGTFYRVPERCEMDIKYLCTFDWYVFQIRYVSMSTYHAVLSKAFIAIQFDQIICDSWFHLNLSQKSP